MSFIVTLPCRRIETTEGLLGTSRALRTLNYEFRDILRTKGISVDIQHAVMLREGLPEFLPIRLSESRCSITYHSYYLLSLKTSNIKGAKSRKMYIHGSLK
jgi:hypothetical protein